MNAKRILALFAAVALPVSAQTATPRVDQRQANQEARIQQGAKADGKVTARERAKLARAQDKQSRKIAKQKHDKQTAPAK